MDSESRKILKDLVHKCGVCDILEEIAFMFNSGRTERTETKRIGRCVELATLLIKRKIDPSKVMAPLL